MNLFDWRLAWKWVEATRQMIQKKSTPVISNRFKKHVSQSTFLPPLPPNNSLEQAISHKRVSALSSLAISLSITLTINYKQYRGITIANDIFCECTTKSSSFIIKRAPFFAHRAHHARHHFCHQARGPFCLYLLGPFLIMRLALRTPTHIITTFLLNNAVSSPFLAQPCPCRSTLILSRSHAARII